MPQPRVQPLSLPDTLLGHPMRLRQNHPNPGASSGPRASYPPSAARERQRTSARCKPATVVLRSGPLGSSVAGNSPSGGASPTPPSRCSRLGATRGGSGRKRPPSGGRGPSPGEAPPIFRSGTPISRSHWSVMTPAPKGHAPAGSCPCSGRASQCRS